MLLNWKRITRNLRGEGIVTAMIAAGILVITVLALTQISTFQNRASRGITMANDYGELVSSLNRIFRDNISCQQALVGKQFNPAYITAGGISPIGSIEVGGKSFVDVGSTVNGLRVTTLAFDRILQDLGPAQCGLTNFVAYAVNLRLIVGQPALVGSAAGWTDHRSDFQLVIYIDPVTNIIQGCGNSPCSCKADSFSCILAADCCNGQCPWGTCCAPNGSACTAGTQCCSGTCTAGACCVGNTGACTANSDCCSGLCAGGVCAACKPDGMACGAGTECCSSVCTGGVCGAPACSADGAACISGAQCCGGVCSAGFCGAPGCDSNGAACASAATCCSGQCNGGACGPAGCSSNGSGCSADSDCCSGSCASGTCAPPCKANGIGCGAASECCANQCNAGTCGPPGCSPDGAACAGPGTCCSNQCNGGVCGPLPCVNPCPNAFTSGFCPGVWNPSPKAECSPQQCEGTKGGCMACCQKPTASCKCMWSAAAGGGFGYYTPDYCVGDTYQNGCSALCQSVDPGAMWGELRNGPVVCP